MFQLVFLEEIGKLVSVFKWKHKGPRITELFLKKKKKTVVALALPDFKTFSKLNNNQLSVVLI